MESQYRARRARLSDLPRILAIERAGFGKWAWDRNLFAEYARTCGEWFLVVEGAGKVVGYSITCITRGLASLESIAVAPSVRGKGVADVLLNSTLRRLKRLRVGRLSLIVKHTNPRAIAFYQKRGFRRVRRIPGYYEDGEDGILFLMDL